MMPQNTLDVASLLADELDHPGEIMATMPLQVAGLVPERSLFVVITAEGRRFRVLVEEEQPAYIPESAALRRGKDPQ